MAVLPSPLSSSIDGINQSTVSGNIFGGDRQDPETKSKLQSLTFSISSLQNQVNELSKNNITNIGVFSSFQESFSNQIGSVRSQLDKVNDTLESVATTIASESVIERQKDLIEQENQKKLAESGARGGQESLLETKIQSALSEPLSRIGNTVSFGFQNLMSFITTLLGGWLTLEGIKTIKAYQDDNKTKLDDIKDSVLKTLGIAGGIFLIINVGIGKVIGSITGLVGKIGRFLLKNTIGRVFQGASSVIKTATRAVTGSGGKEAAAATRGAVEGSEKGGLEGLFSNIGKGLKGVAKTGFSLALGGFEFIDRKKEGQTNVQAGAGTAASMAGAEVLGTAGAEMGSIFGPVGSLLGGITGAGVGWFGAGKGADLLTGVNKPKEKKEPPKPQSPTVKPITPKIPPASDLKINTPDTKIPPTTSEPSTTSTPPPDASKIKQYEMAWQYRNNPMARGRIEGAWNKMNNEEKQQAINWATSKGYDWKEMKLPDINTSAQVTGNAAETPSITPAEVSKVPTVPFNIGPEPELKPNIVYASSGSSNPQQQPLKTGPASDVPFISSSNSDNFYALYSQINYNIIT
jgi:hypothetical protein